MARHAKSLALKQRERIARDAQHEQDAVNAFHDGVMAYQEGKGPKVTYNSIAKRFNLDSRLLKRRVEKIGQSKCEANAMRGRLTETEATILIDFAIEMAYRGFPLKLETLEKYALEIVRARDPSVTGLGKNWAARFVRKYGKHISMKWCISLESIRAKSANSTTIGHFYDILLRAITENKVPPHLIFNFDETSCPIGVGQW